MGKKKAQGGTKQHATQSFAELVGEANRNALKPYIHEVFGHLADSLSQRMFKQMANIQTRIMALETILTAKLNLTQEQLENAVMDVEDTATGYQTVNRPATPGDLLRISLRTRPKGQADWSDTQRRQVTNLMNFGKPEGGPLSLGSVQVEGALIGMSKGDSKLVVLEEEFQVELSIDRVSEKIAKPEVVPIALAPSPTQEVVNENQNA